MKQCKRFLIASAILLSVGFPSAFGLVEIGLDLPVSSSLEGTFKVSAGSLELKRDLSQKKFSGLGFYAVLFGFGVGYDQLDHDFKIGEDDNATLELKQRLYNLFYRIDLPLVHFDLGGVAGSAEIKNTSGDSLSESGNSSGFLLRAGVNVLPLVAVNLGYRSLTSSISEEDLVKSEVDITTNIVSLGLSFGF